MFHYFVNRKHALDPGRKTFKVSKGFNLLWIQNDLGPDLFEGLPLLLLKFWTDGLVRDKLLIFTEMH